MACGTVREPPALDPEGAFNGASPAVQMAGLREYASKSWDGGAKTVNISERAGRMQKSRPNALFRTGFGESCRFKADRPSA